ncbi:hypothetical protein R2R35_23395 [Anaerocolumna sp. AGMB13020]|uniref:hypothetical protein n=1 Tax=Anaerocolumna sp. AGMB13020 TaxID=3081750 RepID=UPI0029539119|nr:hypothetical protein [Anaerocolumna sp. AGMB13020]WOO36702.1 hypothetical protein R2R35_23395 [Anaerocolumna sp. AGMB13020]
MIVDTSAYVLSMLLVLFSCIIRDFLIPLFVWRKYLRNKSYGYRFWFCVLTQAALQINLVLLLGFLDICNRYTIIAGNLLVYLLIIWNYSDKRFFQHCKEGTDALWNAYKEERLIRFMVQEFKALLKALKRTILQMQLFRTLRKNWLEAGLLISLVIYNIWFLTYNVLRYHCYQFSDIPIHQSWIYDLEHGTLFSDGIYPFGMHAMVYIIRIIFDLNLREILLYAGAYQTVLMMIGLYLLAKEIFYGKYTPVTVVLFISFMLNQGRYAASLPQEAGMYTVIGVAYFMIRYLRKDRQKLILEKDSRIRRFFRINAYINRRYIDSDACLLILCVALVIAYHFYTAIAAVFLVLATGIAFLPRVLKKQYFIPLLFSGIMGAVIAVMPFAACLAKGIPFQESMAWATSVIADEEWNGKGSDYQQRLEEAQGKGNNTTGENGSDTAAEEIDGKDKKPHVNYSAMTFVEIVRYFYQAMFNFGLLAMFGASATQFMFFCIFSGFLCAVIMLFRKKTRNVGHVYIAIILNMIVLCIVGAAEELGFIELIAAARASTFAEPFIGLIFMLPVDFAFRILGFWKNRHYQFTLKGISAVFCGVAAIMIVEMGWYHSFFDVNQAYYNESEYLLRHIKKSYERNTYTIVSPTDEYYDILDYGYHTELSEFIDMVNGNSEEFTFPTEYVFFFIEKKVLQDYTYGPVNVNIKYAAMDFTFFGDAQDYYFQRAVIESQAFYWAQKISQIYPRNFKIYYEDDIYVAYILEQNTYSPYNLKVDYLADYVDEIKANGWNAE